LGNYALVTFPVFEIVESSAVYKRWTNIGRWKMDWTRFYVARTMLVACTFVIAISIPKFGLFVNLLGALSGTVLAFIMPIMIYDQVHKENISNIRKFAHRILIVFGVVVGCLATAMSVYELYKAFKEQPLPQEIPALMMNVTNSTGI
jgi:amino acid permease